MHYAATPNQHTEVGANGPAVKHDGFVQAAKEQE